VKVLLSAYSCLPGTASLAEPGIGWNWARSIAANGHEVVVLTRTVGREYIEEYFDLHPAERMRFAYHDLSRPWLMLYRLPLGNYLYNLLWQHSAARVACELHRTVRFDRVQHITWGSFRVPSFMGRLGIPFTFGPVGGGEDTPPRLRAGLGWRGRLWDALRRISSAVIAPLMGPTYASATEIVAATEETRRAIPARYRDKTLSRQAVGIDSTLLRQAAHGATPQRNQSAQPDAYPETRRLELLFVGRLLAWKGVHLMLKALERLGAGESEIRLTVIGAGSDSARLHRLARQLKVEKLVAWVPWMRRDALIKTYADFDLFTFPSLHDSGGMAVLEALTFGLPVVCLDLGGPAMAVNDRCGRVIPTANLDEDAVVARIAAFLAEMLADRAALARLSDGARARAASLTWQAIVDAVYRGSLVSKAS
jgi:glycosyltransferase involved in cell wall biosynthesis